MKKTYLAISMMFFTAAVFFGWLGMTLMSADGMTPEEYAQQAQRLVCEQTMAESTKEDAL